MTDELRALLALAQPDCPAPGGCSAPVQRVEMLWHLDEDGRWRPTAKTLCGNAHRVIVEPLP